MGLTIGNHGHIKLVRQEARVDEDMFKSIYIFRHPEEYNNQNLQINIHLSDAGLPMCF